MDANFRIQFEKPDLTKLNREYTVVDMHFHIRKVTSNDVRLKTNIFNYPNLMEKNIRYSYTYLNSKSKIMKNSLRRSINGRLQRKRHQP